VSWRRWGASWEVYHGTSFAGPAAPRLLPAGIWALPRSHATCCRVNSRPRADLVREAGGTSADALYGPGIDHPLARNG